MLAVKIQVEMESRPQLVPVRIWQRLLAAGLWKSNVTLMRLNHLRPAHRVVPFPLLIPQLPKSKSISCRAMLASVRGAGIVFVAGGLKELIPELRRHPVRCQS